MNLATKSRSAIMRSIRVLAPLALCVAFILGCGGDQPEAQPASPQTTAPDKAAVSVAAPPLAAPPETNAAGSPAPLLVPTPTPGPLRSISTVPYGPGVPSLDENIFHADVIAWVRPPTVTGKSKTIPSGSGVAPTYQPFVEFRFEVVEYLKGSGGGALTVESSQHHTYLTDSEALSVATNLVAGRSAAPDELPPIFNSVGDDRGAVVFLRLPDDGNAGSGAAGASTQVYYFETSLPRTGSFNSGNTDVFKKSWLPTNDASSGKSGVAADASGDSEAQFINPDPTGSAAEPSAPTLEYLRSRVKAVADMLAEGEGVEGYEECVAFRFAAERSLRAQEEADGQSYTLPNVEEGPFASGLPTGSEIYNTGVSIGRGYSRWWYEGRDADLFQTAIAVEGVDITPDYVRTRDDVVGYEFSTRVARPLPSGTYKAKLLSQAGKGIPCDFYHREIEPPTWTFTFEAPAGTLHEAFFDPAAIGGGAGADKDNGVLKPTAFSLADGSGVSLQSVAWNPSAVEMRLEPHTPLAGYHADFIALDGTVSLRLDFDDASETGEGESRGLSWPLCVQPWRDGDLLMLRISESPPDLTGATRDADCAPAPTATAVPSTATPAPDAPTAVPATATPAPDAPTATPVTDTPTPVPATATPALDTPAPIPATATPDAPTDTPASTQVQATATPSPDMPTPTQVPATATPIPATATPDALTPTDAPTPTPAG